MFCRVFLLLLLTLFDAVIHDLSWLHDLVLEYLLCDPLHLRGEVDCTSFIQINSVEIVH